MSERNEGSYLGQWNCGLKNYRYRNPAETKNERRWYRVLFVSLALIDLFIVYKVLSLWLGV